MSAVRCTLPFAGGEALALRPRLNGWLPISDVAAPAVSFHIFLKEDDEAHARAADAVSDPRSAHYRQFHTATSQAALSSPTPDAFDEVRAWLTEEGAASIEIQKRQDHLKVVGRDTHGALSHRAPSSRCTADPMHHVWHRSSARERRSSIGSSTSPSLPSAAPGRASPERQACSPYRAGSPSTCALSWGSPTSRRRLAAGAPSRKMMGA